MCWSLSLSLLKHLQLPWMQKLFRLALALEAKTFALGMLALPFAKTFPLECLSLLIGLEGKNFLCMPLQLS